MEEKELSGKYGACDAKQESAIAAQGRTRCEGGAAKALGLQRLTRRSFVGASACAGASLALFLAGCAPRDRMTATASASYTAGTYAGTGEGKFDVVGVEVDFSESVIEAIRVTGHRDTARIAEPAARLMPERIVDAQGLGVDAVTGATLTSMGILEAVASCVDQAGGSSSALRKIGSPEPVKATESLEADVVVVGAGASGMGAAVAAAQQGKRVVVLEKNSNLGGNCLVSGGYLEYLAAPEEARPEMTPALHRYVEEVIDSDLAATFDAALVDSVRRQYEGYKASGSTTLFDSPEFYALDFAVTTGEGLPPEAYLPVARNITALNQWMDELDFPWQTPTHLITGYTYPRWSNPTTGVCGEGYFDFFENVVEVGGYDIEVMLACAGEELLVVDDAVVGVRARAEDGTTWEISANAAILATGGFSGNAEMLRQYNTLWPYPDGSIATTNVNGHTGDGVLMAQAAGAGVVDMGNQMMFPFNDPITMSAENVSATFADSPIVNKQGRRFLDETADRFVMTAALMEQEESLCFMVSDANSVCVTEASPGEDTLLRRGQLFKADTLEELANLMGVPADAFVAEMERYNGFCEKGIDEDFGRYFFDELSPVKVAPFYAAPATWAAHITIGGLDAPDDDYRVRTEGGAVISGLYACGEVRNGICGVGSIADGVACGKRIAQNA